MMEAGISWVRIGEFAWSCIEPAPNEFDWDWLDDAIQILGEAGLKIVMCTPTATPPKWVLEQMPDMIAIDANGLPRRFGSRRHYSFAHQGYREQSKRISQIIAKRYGENPYVHAWQTDNEYGCHDTAISYCNSALVGFRLWLKRRYKTIEILNEAWGNVFWSMLYRDFNEIELPNLTVTEVNPAHSLDFRRYSTDEVRAFNLEQVEILRKYSRTRPISHNFMGMFNQFDHRAVARDIDIAAWDSYPIGMLQNMQASLRREPALEHDCLRTGDPDFQAFHHDLYRGMGRLWIMEQQPGPVNWALTNAIPKKNAVRMWSWEAIAHGAEVISYFRWRQAPFGQEQMHAGLMRRDNTPAQGLYEVKQFNQEISMIDLPPNSKAPIAIIHDYTADWMTQLDGQTKDFHYLRLLLDVYGASRQNGATIDVVGANDSLDGYALILIPSLMHVSEDLAKRLQASQAIILAGPRIAAKTQAFQLPENLPPGLLSDMFGLRVLRVDALPRSYPIEARWNGQNGKVSIWLEEVQHNAQGEGQTDEGMPLIVSSNRARYLTAWPDRNLLKAILKITMLDAGLKTHELPPYLRMRQRGNILILNNYGPEEALIPNTITGHFLIGERCVPSAGVAVIALA